MKTAEDWDKENVGPITDEELQNIREKLDRGSVVLLRKPPWMCGTCGKIAVRNFRYVGDIDECGSTWQGTCDNCGTVWCS